MSGREWAPGDVALYQGHVAFVWDDEAGLAKRPTFIYTDEDGDPCSVWADGITSARRLLVLDPEDRAQVERLLTQFYDGLFGAVVQPEETDAMQAALRSLLAPPPEVLEHYPGRTDQAGTVVSVCGKVWRPAENVTVVGRCETCEEIVSKGWVS